MNLYLIDYENVTETGLSGTNELTADDHVIVFYSAQIKNISFERHVEIAQCPATFEYIKIQKTGKNYLDFQLSTYLGFLIGKENVQHIYIVTKDTGYDSVIDFWASRSYTIQRVTSIYEIFHKPLPVPKSATSQTSVKTASAKATTKATTSKSPSDLPENWRKKVRAAVKSDKLAPSSYSIVYKAIATSKTKIELNNRFVKAFQTPKGSNIYNHVKEIYEQYMKSLT